MIHPTKNHPLTDEQRKVIREFRDALGLLRRETGLERAQRHLASAERGRFAA